MRDGLAQTWVRYVALCLLTCATPVAAQTCQEPSALDQQPDATPLEVSRIGTRRVDLTWGSATGDGYRIRRGNLQSLLSSRAYSHHVVVENAESPQRVTVPADVGAKNFYFLITTTCGALSSSAGRDSARQERPVGGTAELSFEVSWASDLVLGVDTRLSFDAARVFTSGDSAEAVGPYSLGASGSPLNAFNAPPTDGEFRSVQTLFPGDPDPSFLPPERVYRLRVGYFGPALSVDEFEITRCQAADAEGLVLDATCGLVDFVVLY